jgi:hypothetical protein
VITAFQVSVPILSNFECENLFLRGGYIRPIPDNFLCAGFAAGGSDTCQVTEGRS